MRLTLVTYGIFKEGLAGNKTAITLRTLRISESGWQQEQQGRLESEYKEIQVVGNK